MADPINNSHRHAVVARNESGRHDAPVLAATTDAPLATATFECFVAEPPVFDFGVYVAWLNGESAPACARRLLRSTYADVNADAAAGHVNNNGSPRQRQQQRKDEEEANRTELGSMLLGAVSLESLVEADVRDQFRTFALLKAHLDDPQSLVSQPLVRLDAGVQRLLIHHYYAFDRVVLRRIMGRKLTPRLRRDLADVAADTGVPLSSCQRQFDNMRRVYRAVVEVDSVPLANAIAASFCLSHELADAYARFVFLSYNRIESSKKKLAFLTYEDLDFLAGLLMEMWTAPVAHPGSGSAGDGGGGGGTAAPRPTARVELDKRFTSAIRDLKSLLNEKEVLDEYCALVTRPETPSGAFDTPPATPTSADSGGPTPSTSFVPDNTAAAASPTDSATAATTTGPGSSLTNLSIEGGGSARNLSASPSRDSAGRFAALSGDVRSLLKGLLTIGAGLSQAKEFRDIVEDIVEKVAEPLVAARLTVADVDALFERLAVSFRSLSTLGKKFRRRFAVAWDRYLAGVRSYVVHIHTQVPRGR